MNANYDASGHSPTERRMSPSERLLAAGALLGTVARSIEAAAMSPAVHGTSLTSERLHGFAKLLRVIAGSIAVNVPRLPSTSAMDAARAEIVRLQRLLEMRT